MSKGRYIIRLIAGGYVAYLGVNIIQSVQEEPPNHYMFIYAASAFFIIAGVSIVLLSLRSLHKLNLEEKKAREDSEPEPEPVPEVKSKKSMLERAQMANNPEDEGVEEPEEGDGSRLQDTEEMVPISSEDIIAAAEEMIETSENENTVANIDIDIEVGAGDEDADD